MAEPNFETSIADRYRRKSWENKSHRVAKDSARVYRYTARAEWVLLTFGQRSSVQLFSSIKRRSSVQLAGYTACTWVVFSNQKLPSRQSRRASRQGFRRRKRREQAQPAQNLNSALAAESVRKHFCPNGKRNGQRSAGVKHASCERCLKGSMWGESTCRSRVCVWTKSSRAGKVSKDSRTVKRERERGESAASRRWDRFYFARCARYAF